MQVENLHNLPGAPDRRILAQIEVMAGLRMPIRQMAAILLVSEEKLRIWSAIDPDVKEAIATGRALVSQQVRQVALYFATSGKHPEMTKFWLKAHEGWNDNLPQQKLAAKLGLDSKRDPWADKTDDELMAAAAEKLAQLGIVRPLEVKTDE